MKPLNLLITAGPTREPIDPVRFISNNSTGFMGYTIAQTAKKRGHKITLISGPCSLSAPSGINLINILTAAEMFNAVKKEYIASDCIIMSAAVADFRPAEIKRTKIKRSNMLQNIRVVNTQDILFWLGKRKMNRVLIGFCMETSNLEQAAKKKLKEKNLDLIVANKIGSGVVPFGQGKTSVLIIDSSNNVVELKYADKGNIALKLLDKIELLWYKKRNL